MADTQTIKMARASNESVDGLMNFLQELEEKSDSYDVTADELGEWVIYNFHRAHGVYERILFGYKTLVDNACDPSLDYLDYKPSIRHAQSEIEFLRGIIRGDRTIADVDIDEMVKAHIAETTR